eukprot:scaffold6808_cov144-Amphora_coffeaeformis.AAC.6
MAAPNELEAWREVHSKLLIACELAQESVDAERMQHRYWMEELAVNLTDEGQLTANSVWAKACAPKKTLSKKKMNLLYRRRKGRHNESLSKGKGKRKAAALQRERAAAARSGGGDDASLHAESSAAGPPRKLRIKMKKHKPATAPAATPTYAAAESDDSEEDEEEDLDTPSHQYGQEEYSAAPAAHPYHHGGGPMQNNNASNPLQMMAAVAFGTSPAGYAPMGETPSYSTYLTSGHPRHHSLLSAAPPFYSRASASNMATYSSLQDVADEDDDEDAF